MISKKKLIELYSAMVMCRMIAERAQQLAREGNLSPGLDAGLGREAALAGIAVDLLPGDTLQTTRAAFVSSFLQGMPLGALFAGAARWENGHTRENAEPVDLEGACAAAEEHRISKDGKIVVAFCDAEQTESKVNPGRWRRSLSLAGRGDLPVIFVRHFGVRDVDAKTRTRKPSRARQPEALEFGVPVIYVDGDDVVAMYRVASESIARARQRRGPTLIECIANQRAGSEREGLPESGRSGSTDPIAIMENHLAGKGLLSRGLRKKITEGFTPELDKATRWLAQSVQLRA